MTDMRDARLQKALQEAPDAHVRPAAQVSQAILAAARNALPASPPLPVTPPQATQGTWWKRLWESTARPAAPWSAAFATVLVAVLVTVMWVRDPVLEMQPVADAPQPVTAPAKALVAAPATAAPSMAEVKTPAIAAATPSTSPVDQSRSALEKAAPVPQLEMQKQADKKASAAEVSEAADTQARTSRADMERAAAPTAPSAAAPSAAAPFAVAPRAAAPVAIAPAAPAAAIAPPAAPPAAAAAAPAPMLRSGANTSGLEGWTALQVQIAGRLAVVDRARGQKLYAAMLRLARQLPAATGMPPAMPANEPVMRLTVLAQGETQAVMVLWESTVLWQRPPNDDVLGSVSGAEIQALLQLARQALGAEPAN